MDASKPTGEIPSYKQPGLTYSQRVRMQVDMAAADKKEAPLLWQTIRSSIEAIVASYIMTEVQPLAYYEAHLHDMWYTFVQAAKVTPADDPAMDRLALLVIAARERGPVSRIFPLTPAPPMKGHQVERQQQQQQQEGEDSADAAVDINTTASGAPAPSSATVVEHAIFPGGARLFTDLPFLVPDLLAAWKTILFPSSPSASSSRLPSPAPTTTASTAVSAQHRHNLASFTARLVGLGVCRGTNGANQLALPALWLLRAVAETKDSVGVDTKAMLVAVREWTMHAGHELLGMAVRGEHCERARKAAEEGKEEEGKEEERKVVVERVEAAADDDVELGELAREAGVAAGRGGWSLARWDFWKRRFGALKRVFEERGDEEGAGLAARCAASLQLKEENVGCRMKEREAALKAFYQVA